MSAANITPPDPQSALSTAANFLLSLNAGLGGDNAKADVFSKFLLQTQNHLPQSYTQSQSSQRDAQPKTQAQAQSQSQTQTSTPTSTGSSDSASSAPTLPSLPVLKKLVSAWRQLVDRLQGHKTTTADQKTQASQTDIASSNTAAAANAGASGVTVTQADNSSTDTGDTAGTSDATAADNSNSGADPKTLDDILKELQMLALLIEKQLQNLQNGNSGAAAGTTAATGGSATDSVAASGSASASSAPSLPAELASLIDPASPVNPSTSTTSAPDSSGADTGAAGTGNTADGTSSDAPTLTQALTDLLTLVQLAAKQLEGVQAQTQTSTQTQASTDGAGLSTDPTQTAALTSSIIPSDAQLSADLKVLLTSLRASIATNKGQNPSNPVSGTTAPSLISDTPANVPDASTTSGAADPSTTTPEAHVAWTQQQDFLALFKMGGDHPANQPAKNDANNNFTPAAAAGVAAAATDAGSQNGGASLDLNMDGQNNNNAARNDILGNNAANNSTSDSSSLAGIAGNNVSAANPYSFASQLSATRAANGGTTGLPDVFEQVILQINRNVKDGNDQMTIHLNPADLGRVDVNLNFSSDGKVQGTVVASNPATLHLLLKDVRGLERALQEAGVRADPGSLQFSLGNQNQSGNFSNQTSGNSSGGYSGASASDTASDTITDLSDLSSDTNETYYLTPNRVNLRV